jgi:hypothetical protein
MLVRNESKKSRKYDSVTLCMVPCITFELAFTPCITSTCEMTLTAYYLRNSTKLSREEYVIFQVKIIKITNKNFMSYPENGRISCSKVTGTYISFNQSLLFSHSHPDDVDLWSAGISERPMPGSMVGPTFNCLIARTFRDVRRGDRFWYENSEWPSSFTPGKYNCVSLRLCNEQPSWKRTLPEKLTDPQLFKNILPFMGPEDSLPCSQQLTTGHHLEPDESNTQSPNLRSSAKNKR